MLLNLPSRCTGSASFMFATHYIKSFNERICSSIFRLLCHLHQPENPLFVNYFHTDIHFRSSMIPIVHIILYCIFTLFFFNYFNHLLSFIS